MEEDGEFKSSKEKVILVKDVYGGFTTATGENVKVYRFTWYSHNRIQVQVITYGARIIAMKAPCRNGVVEDIVMGFDKLSDYLNRDSNNFGATIGRTAGPIENATFVIQEKQYWVYKNNNPHHLNGGKRGFQKKLFTPFVDGTKLILSCISDDGDEGYPGTVLLRITYELSPVNEFQVNMEAFTTRETVINLTNCLYFNLAGHGAGFNEMRRHYVTINANCFIVKRSDGLPTGEIKNVMNTDFDYQIPALFGRTFQDKQFDQCFCVNRGVDQENCFIASLFHPHSGRLLEIYSNQPGLNVSLPNKFGVGLMKYNKEVQQKRLEDILDILTVIHSRAKKLLQSGDGGDLAVVRDLVGKLRRRAKGKEKPELSGEQVEYLKIVRNAALAVRKVPVFVDVADLISLMLPPEKEEEEDGTEYMEELEIPQATEKPKPKYNCNTDKRFIGKNGAIYVDSGAICLQTQNYPNAMYHKSFPNCVLRPGEIYKHTIVYKFWVRAGSPAKWMRRTNKEFRD